MREGLAGRYRDAGKATEAECRARQDAALKAAGYDLSDYETEFTDEQYADMDRICDPILAEYPADFVMAVYDAEDALLVYGRSDALRQASRSQREAVSTVFDAALARCNLALRTKTLALVHQLAGAA